MPAAFFVFKLNVQIICQLQQDRIEVSFEMTGLRYQWIPMANHRIFSTGVTFYGAPCRPMQHATRCILYGIHNK